MNVRGRGRKHVYLHNIKSSSFSIKSFFTRSGWWKGSFVYKINPRKAKKLLVDGRKSFRSLVSPFSVESIQLENWKERSVEKNPRCCLSIMTIIWSALSFISMRNATQFRDLIWQNVISDWVCKALRIFRFGLISLDKRWSIGYITYRTNEPFCFITASPLMKFQIATLNPSWCLIQSQHMRLKNLNSSYSIEFNHPKAFHRKRFRGEFTTAGCASGEFIVSPNGVNISGGNYPVIEWFIKLSSVERWVSSRLQLFMVGKTAKLFTATTEWCSVVPETHCQTSKLKEFRNQWYACENIWSELPLYKTKLI